MGNRITLIFFIIWFNYLFLLLFSGYFTNSPHLTLRLFLTQLGEDPG
ncbi:hypothetical protein ENTCAN_06353 [Enterobacter cancerogenus ATCC 35316]|nr:hypothetical protein ENTCAN_06353 [Enterobacter cancerogenus ATCC 35316]